MTNRSLAYSGILTLLLGCLLSGCGGGESSDTEAAATAQTAAQTVPAQIKIQPPAEDPKRAQEIEDLVRKLRSSDEREAYDAVLKLAMFADETSADALLEVARHESEPMRGAALRGLAHMGDKRALDLVLRDLRSSDLDVKRNAAGALGNFKKNEEVIEPLIDALLDDDGWVRMNAQGSLEKVTRQHHQTYDAWREWYRSR